MIRSFKLFLLLSCFIALTHCDRADRDAQHNINGASLVSTPEKLTPKNIASLEQTGADWLSLIPYAFCQPGRTQVYYNTEKQWFGETPQGLRHTAKLARQKGFKLMLKPQIWVGGSGWTGSFNLNSEKDWKQWEQNYRAYILKMAQLAEKQDIALFCIGTELKIVAKERTAFWKQLIADVRELYSGKITYAANWDNYQNIKFWKALDYVGIDAYFPLSQKKTPELSTLKEAWKKPSMNLKNFHSTVHKPILFTEFGYRNIDRSAGKQWELPPMRTYDGKLNNRVQVRAYRAFLENFWDKSWVAGGFFWKWFPQHESMKTRINSGYSPQHKPAQKLIQSFYAEY